MNWVLRIYNSWHSFRSSSKIKDCVSKKTVLKWVLAGSALKCIVGENHKQNVHQINRVKSLKDKYIAKPMYLKWKTRWATHPYTRAISKTNCSQSSHDLLVRNKQKRSDQIWSNMHKQHQKTQKKHLKQRTGQRSSALSSLFFASLGTGHLHLHPPLHKVLLVKVSDYKR